MIDINQTKEQLTSLRIENAKHSNKVLKTRILLLELAIEKYYENHPTDLFVTAESIFNEKKEPLPF